MRSGAYGDAQFIEDHPHIVRMHSFGAERHDAAFPGLRPVNPHAGDCRKTLRCIIFQRRFMAVRRLQVDPVQVTDRLGQSDRSDIVRGSGFEFQRQFGIGRPGKRHGPDHIAAAHKRRHFVQQTLFPVQDAYSGRPI